MQHVTVIGTSLNPESKSQLLADQFKTLLDDQSIANSRVDLRTMDLPFAGSPEGWESADAQRIKAEVERASHVIFALPIYCYDVNAAAKNVIELIGRSFNKKVVAFMCTAGGESSYMSVMGFANHLMLDFRSVIVPRFLYVPPGAWSEEGTLSLEIQERMAGLLNDMREIQILEQ